MIHHSTVLSLRSARVLRRSRKFAASVLTHQVEPYARSRLVCSARLTRTTAGRHSVAHIISIFENSCLNNKVLDGNNAVMGELLLRA